jgi:hypothetical protein
LATGVVEDFPEEGKKEEWMQSLTQ